MLIPKGTYEDAMLAYRAECDNLELADVRAVVAEGQPMRGFFARRAQDEQSKLMKTVASIFDMVAQLEARGAMIAGDQPFVPDIRDL
jgi:hypothetical protein